MRSTRALQRASGSTPRTTSLYRRAPTPRRSSIRHGGGRPGSTAVDGFLDSFPIRILPVDRGDRAPCRRAPRQAPTRPPRRTRARERRRPRRRCGPHGRREVGQSLPARCRRLTRRPQPPAARTAGTTLRERERDLLGHRPRSRAAARARRLRPRAPLGQPRRLAARRRRGGDPRAGALASRRRSSRSPSAA